MLLELNEPARDWVWLRFLSKELGGRRQIPADGIARLIARLALLLEAEVTVEAALSILSGSLRNGLMKRSIDDILGRVRAGAPLSDAIAADDRAFPAEIVVMVRAGEASGALAQTLQRLGRHLTQTEAVRQSTRSALIYPIILLVSAAAAILLVLMVVTPALEPVITQSGLEPPLPARLAFLASAFVREYGLASLLVTTLIGWCAHRAMADPTLKARRDSLLLRVPVLGRALRCNDTGRFARTLGGLLEGGVPLSAALTISHPVIRNRVVADSMARVAVGVREGKNLSGLLVTARVLPDLAVQLILIGEATGRLSMMLVQLAGICEQDTKRTLDRALTLLVPLLTIFVGVIIAGIIGSVMMTVLSINELVR